MMKQKTEITHSDVQSIKDFLLGAAYVWKKENPKTEFALRDLMGGVNFDWDDTPLMELYYYFATRYGVEQASGEEQQEANKKAIQEAGKRAGKILSELMSEKTSHFEEASKGFMAKTYGWKQAD